MLEKKLVTFLFFLFSFSSPSLPFCLLLIFLFHFFLKLLGFLCCCVGRKIGENKSQMALCDKKGRECSEGKYLVERLEAGGVVVSRGRRMGRGGSGGEV